LPGTMSIVPAGPASCFCRNPQGNVELSSNDPLDGLIRLSLRFHTISATNAENSRTIAEIPKRGTRLLRAAGSLGAAHESRPRLRRESFMKHIARRRRSSGAAAAATMSGLVAAAVLIAVAPASAASTLRAGAEAQGRYFGVGAGTGTLGNSSDASLVGSQF